MGAGPAGLVAGGRAGDRPDAAGYRPPPLGGVVRADALLALPAGGPARPRRRAAEGPVHPGRRSGERRGPLRRVVAAGGPAPARHVRRPRGRRRPPALRGCRPGVPSRQHRAAPALPARPRRPRRSAAGTTRTPGAVSASSDTNAPRTPRFIASGPSAPLARRSTTMTTTSAALATAPYD